MDCMKHSIGLLAVLSIFIATAQAQTPVAAQPEIVLLGVMHDMHMKPELHYSLLDLRHEVEAVKPDLICVEIEPEAFNAPMEGYFPPEAAYLAELAPELHTRVVPSDWRIAWAWQDRADRQTPPEQQKRIEEFQNRIRARFAEAAKQPTIYDFAHGEFQALSDQQFMQIIGENNAADIAAGAWHERNRRIVENCLAASADAKRILFVYGAAHLPQIGRELRDRGLASHLAPRLFTPVGVAPLADHVIARWRRNLENLKAIRDGKLNVSADSALKVKDSKRIANLEEAISVYAAKKP